MQLLTPPWTNNTENEVQINWKDLLPDEIDDINSTSSSSNNIKLEIAVNASCFRSIRNRNTFSILSNEMSTLDHGENDIRAYSLPITVLDKKRLVILSPIFYSAGVFCDNTDFDILSTSFSSARQRATGHPPPPPADLFFVSNNADDGNLLQQQTTGLNPYIVLSKNFCQGWLEPTLYSLVKEIYPDFIEHLKKFNELQPSQLLKDVIDAGSSQEASEHFFRGPCSSKSSGREVGYIKILPDALGVTRLKHNIQQATSIFNLAKIKRLPKFGVYQLRIRVGNLILMRYHESDVRLSFSLRVDQFSYASQPTTRQHFDQKAPQQVLIDTSEIFSENPRNFSSISYKQQPDCRDIIEHVLPPARKKSRQDDSESEISSSSTNILPIDGE